MDKMHKNIAAVQNQLLADVAAGNHKAKAFANMLGGELRAAQKSLELPKGYRIHSCVEEPEYRYRLDVETSNSRPHRLVVIQLNPSTANSLKSDPTIGKVSLWASDEFGHVTFLNLFAIRTPHPEDLIGKPYNALVGHKNDAIIASALNAADTVIFAWGKVHRALLPHYHQRLSALKRLLGDRPVFAVGAPVAAKFPRHGRMWNKGNRQMAPFAI